MGKWARVVVASAVVLTLGVAGCSSDQKKKRRSTSTTTPTTAVTTTTTATTVTTMPAVPPTPIAIPASTDGTSPDGSGCSPPAGVALPDGIWFGQLESVDTAAGTIGLDLACFFVGPAANVAASADGETEIPVPNDYYIRNKVAKIYTLKAAPNVAVLKLPMGGGSPEPVLAGTGPSAAAAMLAEFSDYWIGWVQVSGGWVVVIQQQYVP